MHMPEQLPGTRGICRYTPSSIHATPGMRYGGLQDDMALSKLINVWSPSPTMAYDAPEYFKISSGMTPRAAPPRTIGASENVRMVSTMGLSSFKKKAGC